MKLLLRKAWMFIRKDFLDEASYKLHFIGVVWGALFSVVMYYFLSTLIPARTTQSLGAYGGRYFPFVLVGIAFSRYFDLAMNGMKRGIQRAQMLGTLEALFVTRTRSVTILALGTVYRYIFTSVTAAGYLLIGWLAFDVPFENADWLSAAVVLFLTVACFLSIGMLSTSVILVLKRGDPVSWIFQGLSYLLSGVYYPVEVMPDWLQNVARVLPLTSALRGLRLSLLMGKGVGELSTEISFLAIFTAVLMPLALWVFRIAMRVAKREGSLSHF